MAFFDWKSKLSYKTPQFVKVNNWKLALVYYCFILLMIGWTAFTIIGGKKYQLTDQMVTTSMIKIRGSSSSTDPTTNKIVVWDAQDIIPPTIIPQSAFIATNVITRPSQKRDTCEGGDDKLELCDCGENRTVAECCAEGEMTYSGRKTGKCSVKGTDGASGKYCMLQAWCPILPRGEAANAFSNQLDVSQFTVFVRLNARSSKFEFNVSNSHVDAPQQGHNMWTVADILNKTGYTYEEIMEEGAVILMEVVMDCNLDSSEECKFKVKFKRNDDPTVGRLSHGFNYRYIDRTTAADGAQQRNEYKAKGIMLYVLPHSTAGKFDVMTTSLAIGAGLALLAVAKLITDGIMQYVLPDGRKYKAKKYADFDVETDKKNDQEAEPLMGGGESKATV